MPRDPNDNTMEWIDLTTAEMSKIRITGKAYTLKG